MLETIAVWSTRTEQDETFLVRWLKSRLKKLMLTSPKGRLLIIKHLRWHVLMLG